MVASGKIYATIIKYGPPGSNMYGIATVLPNGNYVVLDMTGGTVNQSPSCGVIYLYNGQNHALISTLKGTQQSDFIGTFINVLPNSNFIVSSPYWNNGNVVNAGAVTLVNGYTGLNGVVNVNNSFVGTTSNDMVGHTIKILSNGNFVVYSPLWNNGAIQMAGAVTWMSGNSPTVGTINVSNSLIGGSVNNFQYNQNTLVGNILTLNNGHYLVCNSNWDNGNATNVGAVTWCNGNGGTTGMISANNSLVGNSANDSIGRMVALLPNGNYVVGSRSFDNGLDSNAGAVTFCNGNTGLTGIVSPLNSMVGSSESDFLENVTPLTNSHFIVSCPMWDNGMISDVGLVKWVDGQLGDVGVLSTTNCWIGNSVNDQVGKKVFSLNNGHGVFISDMWDNNQFPDVGSATWIDGYALSSGVVSVTNSLVGNVSGDFLLSSITPLTNGHYALSLPSFTKGNISQAGAVTWCNGNMPTVGFIDTLNCLYGSQSTDRVGFKVFSLANGNFVVSSPYWNNNLFLDAGAVTWCNGNGGTVGPIDINNSLYGTSSNDEVGEKVYPLKSGHYVITTTKWNNANMIDAGASTWCNGNGGTVGAINAGNSLVGLYSYCKIGAGGTFELNDSNYVVSTPAFGIFYLKGAMTWCNGLGGTVGAITTSNSLIGNDTFSYITITPSDFMAFGNGAYCFYTREQLEYGYVTFAKPQGATSGFINNCNTIFNNNVYFNPLHKYNSVYNYLIFGFPFSNKIYIVYPEGPETTINVQACGSYVFNGQVFSSSGLYLDTLVAASGCDSIIGIHLTIHNPTYDTLNIIACNSYTFNGQTLANSGVYYDTLQNAVGCDSLITLNLTIHNSSTSSSSVTACNSYTFNGQTLTNSGVYYDTLLNAVGCDSLITLNLTIHNSNASSFSVTACDSFVFNGHTYTNTGVYFDTVLTTLGCDSIITLNVSIVVPNSNVTQMGNILTANAGGVSYAWLQCNPYVIIPGANAQTYTATSNGSYAVVIYQSPCSADTSDCYTVNGLSVKQEFVQQSIYTYPSPTHAMVYVYAEYGFKKASVRLMNMNGMLISEYNNVNGSHCSFDMSALASGLYMIQCVDDSGVYVRKVLKE